MLRAETLSLRRRMKGRIVMKPIFTLSLCSLAMAGASGTAIAQSAPVEEAANGGLEEIIVTATKRNENLQDVPVAVSAISATALQNQGVFETSDLNHAAPNLQVSSPYGQQQPNFSLRGVGVGTEFNANAASPVGVYVDEVYQAFRASHGQQLYDLEQIEVVRGPQGTLFGRNTTGGAINFITRKPDLKGSNGYLTLGYGRFNRVTAEGAIEFTPVEDKVGIRVSGTYIHSDPYIRNRLAAGLNKAASTFPTAAAFGNQSTGIDPGITKSYGIRGTIVAKPSETVELTLKGYAAKATGGQEVPLATGQSLTSDKIDYTSPNFLLAPLFGPLSQAGLLPSSYSASARGLSDREVEADTGGPAISRAEGVVFNAKIELADHLKLVSITGYDSGLYSQTPNTDCDATPLRLCSIGYRSSFHAFNQDVRLDYASGPLKLIVGGYYGKDSVTADNRPDFFNILRDINKALGSVPGYFNPGGNFGALLPAGSLPTGITATQHFKQERTSFAIYGEGTYALADTVNLTVGGRYTKDKNKFSEGLTTFFDDTGAARLITVSNYTAGLLGGAYLIGNLTDGAGNVVLPASVASPGARPGPLSRSGKSGRFSGRAILDWKPTEDSLIYASISRGYRAGTFNGLAYGSSSQVYFVPPETVNAYEIGFKSRFADNRVQFNGSFFYYDYKGQQGQVVDSSATANLIALDGTLKGLELEFLFAATDTLKLNASLGILDSKYKHGTCPVANIISAPPQVGNCVASGTGNVDVGGNPFPYAAKSSINLGFDWDAYKGDSGKLTLHGDAAYTGQFYFDSFKNYSSTSGLRRLSTGKFSQGEGKYWVLNSRVTFSTERFSVAAFVKNLTDKTYYPFGIAIENLFGNGYRVRAQPRTFGIEGTVKF
jgi:iron complex outermembrane recepter protein